MAEKAVWRRVFDAAEQPVTRRADALIRTSEFHRSAALAIQLRAALRARAAALSSRALHALNVPAGTDIVRLRAQLVTIDRELRRLGLQLERGETTHTPATEGREDR
jgi:hypothetical protein